MPPHVMVGFHSAKPQRAGGLIWQMQWFTTVYYVWVHVYRSSFAQRVQHLYLQFSGPNKLVSHEFIENNPYNCFQRIGKNKLSLIMVHINYTYMHHITCNNFPEADKQTYMITSLKPSHKIHPISLVVCRCVKRHVPVLVYKLVCRSEDA